MCNYHEGYHTALAWEIEAGDTGSRERREELAYDLPWRALAAFLGAVMVIGVSLSLVIDLLS
jgi:hypothetical protein